MRKLHDGPDLMVEYLHMDRWGKTPRFREFVTPKPRFCTCPNPANYHEVGRKTCWATKIVRVKRWLTGQR